MNYVWLGITIALMAYVAVGVNRSMMIMKAVSHDLKPQTRLEYFGLTLVGIFHVFAWFPYWVASVHYYRKTHANL
jgi:uncharacterized protein YhhL (DUF1145 family)